MLCSRIHSGDPKKILRKIHFTKFITTQMFLSKDEFSKVIINTPLVSIDICILKGRNILLGKRINPPAKDFFFVPGGRIRKSELMKNAFERILSTELGLAVKKDHYKFVKNLGSYEHIYKDNFLGNESFGTHYIVIAYLISYEYLFKKYKKIQSEQHSEYIWFNVNSINGNYQKIHPNTQEYFKNSLIKNF